MKIYNYRLLVGSCIAFVGLFGMTCRVNAQDLQDALKLSQSERYEDAEDLFRQIIQASPGNSDAYFYYGENILKAYIADPYSNSLADVSIESAEQFDKGIKADSTNQLNYIGKGMVILLEKNDTSAADVFFRKAESFFPKNKKKYTEKNVNALIKLGESQLYAREPRYQKAITYLESAKAVAPNNTDSWVTTGEIYETQGNASAAIFNYNKAVYINPKLVVPLVKIGSLYMRSKNLEDARSNFEKAKEIDSLYAPTYRCFGEMYGLAGLENLSILNYRKFLELSGNNIPAKIQYLISLFKAKKYTETLEVAEDILKYDNSRNYLNRIAGYACYDKKPADYEKGRVFMETFFKNTTPDKIIVKDYTYYGRILLKLKDSTLMDKAFEEMKKGYLMDTTDMDLLADIITTAYANEKYDVAIDLLNRKVNNKTADAKDYMNLGKSYFKIQQYDKAITAFDNALNLDANNMQAYTWKASSLNALDPDAKQGLAKPIYETIIKKALSDTARYKVDLFTAYSYLGSYYLYSAKPPEYANAEEYFKKIINLDANNKNWMIKGYTSLGTIYLERKDYAKSLEYYKSVLNYDAKNANALARIEWLKRKLDEIEVQRQLNE
jgi:tetratricopeptide (TPR) repeat protein